MGKGALGQLAAYWPEDTPRHAHVPLKRATEIALFAPAAANAERVALVTAAGEITFADLTARVKAASALLRARAKKNARVAIALDDPAELLIAMLGCWENEMLAYASAEPPPAEALAAFEADLRVGQLGEESITFAELMAGEASEKAEKPDYKKPLLVLPKPGGAGEVGHTHKTLGATAIAMANFLMIDGDATLALLEPPTHWLTLAAVLGTWQKGGRLIAAYGEKGAALPPRVDYAAASWAVAEERILGGSGLGCRVGAGVLVGIEKAFSVSRRRRMVRRLRAPILSVFGRNDLGPVLASHPSWFLDDAAGIPLPNVDTRPMNPKDGQPLNIGWDSVEEAEIGVKSALAPIGGDLIDGWLRSQTVAAIDPTGLYFLKVERILGDTANRRGSG